MGGIVTEGRQVFLGGNDRYIAMCHKCWRDRVNAQKEEA
jgi:thymidine kinase